MTATQKVGAVAVVFFGAILVRTLIQGRKPRIVLPPPSSSIREPVALPPVVDTAELDRRKAQAAQREKELEASLHPPPAPPPPEQPPPPRPAFRASKPGAGPGQPLVAPPGVTEPYTEAGLDKLLAAALAACPMGQLERVSISCEEFPCAVVTIARDEAARQSNLNSCPAWNEVFPGGTQYLDRQLHGTTYRIWTPLPPDDADARIVMARSFARARRLAAGADRGGR